MTDDTEFVKGSPCVFADLECSPPDDRCIFSTRVSDGGSKRETAIEEAAAFIYKDKGDRVGVSYLGWDLEPDDVKDQWRADVRKSIDAYEAALRGSDENPTGEDRASGLRSEGLPARCHEVADARLIERLMHWSNECASRPVEGVHLSVLLAQAASSLSSSKARIEELEKDLADTRYALDISKGCCLRAEAAESRLSKMEKALEEIAAQETERSNATVRRMAGIARSALRSKGETEDGQ